MTDPARGEQALRILDTLEAALERGGTLVITCDPHLRKRFALGAAIRDRAATPGHSSEKLIDALAQFAQATVIGWEEPGALDAETDIEAFDRATGSHAVIGPHLAPERFRGGIERYLEHHIAPGSFLRAVLENDLMGAIGHADEESARELKDLVSWLWQEMPSTLWGSKERVAAWLSARPCPECDTPGCHSFGCDERFITRREDYDR